MGVGKNVGFETRLLTHWLPRPLSGSHLCVFAPDPYDLCWLQMLLPAPASSSRSPGALLCPRQADSPISGPWPPGCRQNCSSLTLPPVGSTASWVYPTLFWSPCVIHFPYTLVRSLKALKSSLLLILQGLAQGLICSRGLIKVCEMNKPAHCSVRGGNMLMIT